MEEIEGHWREYRKIIGNREKSEGINRNWRSLFLTFLTETISRTDEGQPRPKYIFNKCGTNIYFFYCTEIWSIIITELEIGGNRDKLEEMKRN